MTDKKNINRKDPKKPYRRPTYVEILTTCEVLIAISMLVITVSG